jgi:hypothetical protein
LTFTNQLNTSTIVIEKVLDGNDTDENQLFDFAIKIPVGGDALDLTASDTMDAEIQSEDTSTDNPTYTKVTDDDRNSNLEIKVGGQQTDDLGWCSFQLKGGERLVLTNVPVGMIYYVKETDSKGYTTTYAHASGDNTISSTSTYRSGNPESYFTTVNGNNIVRFVNAKNKYEPNTGIRMDVIPYAVTILGIVIVAGAFVIVARKRRNAR